MRIKLDKFIPRDYQLPICRALEQDNFKKLFIILPRRAGKDICAFNLTFRSALKKVGVYFYIFPTYSQARKVIWDSITNTGEKFLDFIPKELISATNSTEMKITLTNGSLIQLVGSDNFDSLVGTNPQGCVFSEYALQDPRAYQFIRPILTANQGWAMFITTPRGKNHAYELYQIASHSPDWFCYKLTVEDTQHISLADIEMERREGILSDDMILQEYYCDFSLGVEGSYYAKYIDKMRLNGQITQVPWEPGFKVNTAWDIGVRDNTSIIFYQTIGMTVRIIDFYEKSKEGLEHYTKMLQSKPYQYGVHIAPHDIAVKEFGSGQTRIEKARQLGVQFTLSNNVSVYDGIESVRSAFAKIWIDERNCSQLIKALENYRQEFDAKKRIYKPAPLHDQWSHASDAMRYLCVSLAKTSDSMTADELERKYRESQGGGSQFGAPFTQPGRW